MREKNVVLVEGKDRTQKTTQSLKKIKYYNNTELTDEKRAQIAETVIDEKREAQYREDDEITIMSTIRLTHSRREGLHDYLDDSDHETVIYNSDKARTDLLRKILDKNISVHDVKTGVTLTAQTPGKVLDDALDTIHEYYRTQRITELNRDWNGGAPPFGFSSENGELVEDRWFDEIRGTLKAVQQGDLTQKQAAKKLGCTRKTVRKCLDNPRRYRL